MTLAQARGDCCESLGDADFDPNQPSPVVPAHIPQGRSGGTTGRQWADGAGEAF